MNRRQTFTIPAGAGAYAPEIMFLAVDPGTTPGTSVPLAFEPIGRARVTVAAPIIVAATIEIDKLKIGKDPRVASSWELAVASMTVAGPSVLMDFSGGAGWRIRAKSGGNAGSQAVECDWTLEREG